MFQKISNCVTYGCQLSLKKQSHHQKHLYLLEILSPVTCRFNQGNLSLNAFDILLGQAFEEFTFSSIDQSPILIRQYDLEFDIPGQLTEYTVGDNAIIHDLMNAENPGQAYVLFTNLDAGLCHAYLDAMEILEEQSDDYSHFQSQKVSGLLFTELLREHEAKISKTQSNFPDREVRYATRDTQAGVIMKYVREHIYDISLKEAAAHFAYQPNYFSRLCQNLYGTTFNELKTHIKLEIAKEQLSMTTKGLEEISQELGYKAVSNFHRNFKAQVGMTPREYRQEHTKLL
ncbi:helix-turn-helix transcriptional regulator [Streptococcus loxodontisalivarius]|uniref:AraC-like DNA-binding protein n=1 Tax=Streptococcus loxodontisalivarius TaxID=1349415 RepID=A0ABS2PR64_9STRE|nr:helix-turn-helix transcriptional regulator [Streptococcus loxodontisalivarius]MBM7642534.1 AraC-like DNA-binding protein [Streptococcus loxodontisalivarius]